ncbi:hypothetical protein A2U01_0075313, partial [Trifolium medium]|nr:hypothetical protein [Trifolium medium]
VFEENKSWDWNKDNNKKISEEIDDEIEVETSEPVTVNVEGNNDDGVDASDNQDT